MKTIKYLIYTLIAAFVLAGCSDDPTYTPGEQEQENCQGVFFPSQENAKDIELDPEEPTTLTFKVMRDKSDDEITVPLEVKSNAPEIFSIEEISFAAGQTEQEFTVSFPNAAIGTTYTCDISVTDNAYAYIYGEKLTGISFSVTRVKWNQVTGVAGETLAKWSEVFIGLIFEGGSVQQGECRVFERDDRPGYYRFENPYNETLVDAMFGSGAGKQYSWPADVVIDATKPEKVYIPAQEIGLSVNRGTPNEFGSITIASAVSENFTSGGSDENYGKLEDGVITFPVGSIVASMANYENGAFKFGNDRYEMTVLLPGAKIYDYSLALSKSEPADGKVKIGAKLGADVTKVKYAFFTGRATASDAATYSGEIQGGEVESKEITTTGTIEAQFDATGMYTIVANIYNEANELQGYDYLSFGYVKAGDDKPVILSVRTELTWEYEAKGDTPENSIRSILFGTGIEAGYMGLFKTSDLAGASSEDLIEIAKTSGKAITADQLKKINDSGISLLYKNLIGGTDYTLLVWAYNGYFGKLYSVKQTTAGKADPLQIHYTFDDVANGLTKAGYCGTWDYYAVDVYDESGNTARQYFGQVTIEDGGTTSGYADFDGVFKDFVKVSGLTGAPQAFKPAESQYMAWDGGLLYVLSPQLVGNVTLQNTDYYVNVAYTAEGDDGVYNGRGLLLGAPVADGLVAFVPNPNLQASNNLTFTGMWFGIYTGYDPATNKFTGGEGGLVYYEWLLLADPALYPASEMAPVMKALSIQPKNYVELRGPELAKVIIDENRMPANRGKDVEEVSVPALNAVNAAVTFTNGIVKESVNLNKIRKDGTDRGLVR